MKAPIDKIRPKPGEPRNDTIQIVVTTTCDLFTCSNCTQLLPFRPDRHMAVDVFRQAVHSLRDWPGIVGIFGGNPCTHPKFPELMAILCEEIPDQRHRGIWTNNLMKHGELVRKVFYPRGRFNLNAHADGKAAAEIRRWIPGHLIPGTDRDPAWHSSILVDYRDLGISEADWIRARESCDINQRWSAAIVEQDGKAVAYFCEVAAALDKIRGQAHGVEVFDGWWREPMARFQQQVGACCDAGCGVPLKLRGRLDRDDTYDVTPSWRDRLPVPRGKVQIEEPEKDHVSEATDYARLRTKR